MYDHLSPRLAKYLAAIYTGTDVPEIERQDIDSRLDAFAVAWRHRTKLLSWNKQRGQKINQLNQRIHEQRLKICELDRRLTFEKRHANALFSFEEFWQQNFFKVNKWNNAHKREIAQLQAKLHDRRVEVKRLQKQVDVFNCILKRKNQRIDDLIGALYSEKRMARELKKQSRGKQMNHVEIKTVIDGHGSVPAYSRDGDAAVDLRASESCYIKAGAVRLVDTGVRVAIPGGYVGLVCPRSGMACKHEVTVINSPGVIDPNYRGSIKVGLVNHNSVGFDIREGDRIAQLLIMPVTRVTFEQVEELDDTERGADGFGSSGR